MAFTEKQSAFIDYYIKTLNASESAKKAGYSEKTARTQGSKMLTNVDIQEEIQKRLREKNNDRIMSQEEVLEGLSKIARNEEEETRDRIKAYELMGKRYSSFTDVVKQNTTNTSIDKLVESIDKIKNGTD